MITKVLNCQTGNKTSLFYLIFATVVCLAVQVFCRPAHAQYQAAGRQLVPILEEIVVAGTEDHPRNDHQTIFPLSDDRLMMVWTEYYSTGVDDSSPTHIVSKISTDKGRTWGAPSVLQENIWQQNVKHPNLIRLPSNEILFFFRGADSSSQQNVFMKRSQDEGESWSEMVQISDPGAYWNNADHAITLSTGRVLLPTHSVVGGGPYISGVSTLESFVYYSDDGFQTWQKGQAMTAPGRGAHELSAVELNDGRLLGFMRTNLGRVYQAYSMDWGVSWSEPEPSVLSAPGSPSQLKRIPQTGDLLAVWNNAEFPVGNYPRTSLTAAISKDEGETWTNYQDIVFSPDLASYSSVFFQDDEAIVMAATGLHHNDITEWIYKVDEFYVTPPPPPPPTPPSYVLSTVAHWRFEGNNGSAVADGATVPTTGTPIRDEIGGNHATATLGGGVTWQGNNAGDIFAAAVPNPDPLDTDTKGTLNANGVNTRSLFFDAGKDCLTVADNDALDFSGAFTLEGYFRTDDDNNVLLNKRDQSSTIGYKVFLDAAGVLHFGVDNGPMWGRVGFDDQILNDDTWHHFAAIRDDDDGLHIWVDGVEDITPETNGVTKISGDLSTDAPLLIGYDGTSVTGSAMNGYLDEIRLSDVALSSALFLINDTEYLPGDANYDGTVNESDAAILATNWQATGAFWGHGDFNNDGIVNDIDAAILAANWQATAGTATTPEPTSCALIVAGILTILSLRQTRNGEENN